MYGRGQLCKLNDSSINNELHERQRRQTGCSCEEEKVPGSPPGRGGMGAGQGQLPGRSWRGSAGDIPAGEGSSGSLAFLEGFPGMVSSPRALLGSGEWAWVSPSRCRRGPNPTHASLPCPRERHLQSHQFGLSHSLLSFSVCRVPEQEAVSQRWWRVKSSQPEEPGGSRNAGRREGAIIGSDCSAGQ